LPPLSSSRTGPPQKLVRQAARPTTPRLQHTVLKRRTPRSRSRRPVGRRLPAVAYPRKSSQNLSQGPIIHRPHPHRKRTGLSEFRAPSRPPPWREADNPALGCCLSRNTPQHVRPEEGNRSSTKPYGRPPPQWWCNLGGGRPGSQPERPIERASSKGGDRTTRGCSDVPRTNFGTHPAPAAPG
jgi:hypothetical protein